MNLYKITVPTYNCLKWYMQIPLRDPSSSSFRHIFSVLDPQSAQPPNLQPCHNAIRNPNFSQLPNSRLAIRDEQA